MREDERREMTEPAYRPATYEDLLEVPDHQVAEIVDGELLTRPRPSSTHARASSMMGHDLVGPFDRRPGAPGGPGGWWIIDEPELHLSADILVPDLAGWRRERMPTFPDVPFFEMAPDWVCEILSPSTVRVDRIRKLPIYAREGVGHVWLVDPRQQTLEVLRLENGHWVIAAQHEGAETIRAEPFDAVELDMRRWWPPVAAIGGEEPPEEKE
jgi:Uma2 family endonuclease